MPKKKNNNTAEAGMECRRANPAEQYRPPGRTSQADLASTEGLADTSTRWPPAARKHGQCLAVARHAAEC